MNVRMKNKYINLIFKPMMTYKDIFEMCKFAYENKYRSVTVPPFLVEKLTDVYSERNEKPLKICSTVGSENIDHYSKIDQFRRLSNSGTKEIEIIISVIMIKSQDWRSIKDELYSWNSHNRLWDSKIKIGLSIKYLTKDEVTKMIKMILNMDIFYLNISIEKLDKENENMIKLIKKLVKCDIMLEVSGDILQKDAVKLLRMGVNVIGTCNIFDNYNKNQKNKKKLEIIEEDEILI